MRSFSKTLNPGEHGGWHTIAEGESAAVANVDIMFREEDWRTVIVYISNFLPSTGTESFEFIVSSNGATFATGASAYSYAGFDIDSAGTMTGFGASATSRIRCTTSTWSAATGRENEIELVVSDPAIAYPHSIQYRGTYWNNTDANRQYFSGQGTFEDSSGISGVRLQLSNGSNISTARYRAIGLKR